MQQRLSDTTLTALLAVVLGLVGTSHVTGAEPVKPSLHPQRNQWIDPRRSQCRHEASHH